MSCKLAFQSSCSQWSFRKVGSRWQKNQEQKAKEKENISILSARTVSTGGCRHCCHGYKITNTYEGLDSSHRHLKKHGLFSGRLKIQTVWRQGDRTLLSGHCGIMGETWPRRGHAHQCCVEAREAKKRGCKINEFATIETPHGQKMTYTGQNNRANFKHTKFTIIHIRWFCSFFSTGLALYWNKSLFKKTNVVQKVSCLINITRRI